MVEFSIKSLELFSFFSQNGISIEIKVLSSLNKFGGILNALIVNRTFQMILSTKRNA